MSKKNWVIFLERNSKYTGFLVSATFTLPLFLFFPCYSFWIYIFMEEFNPYIKWKNYGWINSPLASIDASQPTILDIIDILFPNVFFEPISQRKVKNEAVNWSILKPQPAIRKSANRTITSILGSTPFCLRLNLECF